MYYKVTRNSKNEHFAIIIKEYIKYIYYLLNLMKIKCNKISVIVLQTLDKKVSSFQYN